MVDQHPRLAAGAAGVVITPAVGARLIGFAARPGPAEWIRDDLLATALVLDDGATRKAILACDLCFMHPTLLRTLRRLVRRRSGIGPGDLLVCCSHTHSGPLTYLQPRGGALDRAYIAYLPHLLAGAVAAATRDPRPARLRVGRAGAVIGANRRRPRPDGRVELAIHAAGPADPETIVLRLETPSGAPLATLVNYACHPVILGPRSRAVSADYVGELRRHVAAATGAPCLFLQGACADINPRSEGEDEGAAVGALGARLGQAAIAAWESAVPVRGGPLVARAEELCVPLAEPWAPPHNDRLDLALAQLYRDGLPGPPLTPGRMAAIMDERFPWASELARTAGGGHAVAVPIAALRAGEVAIAGIAGELFVTTGRAIKEGSQLPHTLVACYTNGCIGYLPPRAAYPEGGYEVDEAYRWYRLPAPPEPGSAERLADAVLGLLRTCAADPGG